MIENSDISLIDRHLKNELSPDELNDFNSKLKSNKEFRDFFEMMKPLGLVVERSNLKMDLAEFETELAGKEKISDNQSNFLRSKILKIVFIVLGVVLIVSLAIVISNQLNNVPESIMPAGEEDSEIDSSVIDSLKLQPSIASKSIDSTTTISDVNIQENKCQITDSRMNCPSDGSRIIQLSEKEATIFICLSKEATLVATDTGYLYRGPSQFAIEVCTDNGENTTLSGSGCSLSSLGNGTYMSSFGSNNWIKISVSEKKSFKGSFKFYILNNIDGNSSLNERTKSSGKVSFWTDSGEDGTVKIYIDDKFVGQLDSYFETGQPIFGQKGTFTYSIPTGEHTVLATSSNREAGGKILIEAGDSIIYKLFK